MTVGRVLLWRHGRTAANASFRLQGQIDVPLDEVGRWQARTAAATLVARYEPTAIVSSDLTRAQETAAHLSRSTGLPVVTDERLRERGFGEHDHGAEGKRGGPRTAVRGNAFNYTVSFAEVTESQETVDRRPETAGRKRRA